MQNNKIDIEQKKKKTKVNENRKAKYNIVYKIEVAEETLTCFFNLLKRFSWSD